MECCSNAYEFVSMPCATWILEWAIWGGGYLQPQTPKDTLRGQPKTCTAQVYQTNLVHHWTSNGHLNQQDLPLPGLGMWHQPVRCSTRPCHVSCHISQPLELTVERLGSHWIQLVRCTPNWSNVPSARSFLLQTSLQTWSDTIRLVWCARSLKSLCRALYNYDAVHHQTGLVHQAVKDQIQSSLPT